MRRSPIALLCPLLTFKLFAQPVVAVDPCMGRRAQRLHFRIRLQRDALRSARRTFETKNQIHPFKAIDERNAEVQALDASPRVASNPNIINK